ncbi:3-hydroxyacyl-CoA dehydrogenase family protein [Aeromicrobium sp. 50.2.37]|uniref:3-hydroxyacyl-CoA dehydrogenase family protein n=1 Tax=Aeromicrobium sp. 50.2.37 TaxID=2969305 RepID=UPI00214F7FD7|nr:3-hydroxyacyl-CoA dehydrogenase family protein [Aeromicrobium sp. 50.2.37]MCR4514114.1 3-hydroxyacyl-CoA dehydrogenase family protein [Aeromicrobium sp. 50.2.37]
MSEQVRREVRRVLVVGAGLMGSGIAQVAAQGGFTVSLVDTTDEALERGLARIDDSLARFVRSGRLEEDAADAARRRIEPTTDLETAARAADLVVEAIVEELGPKQELFEKLDRWCDASVVLATNTSQFQIGRVAEPCDTPERVIGMHWSNPPPLMMLVEVILGERTSDASLEATVAFLDSCRREHVVCRKDVPGFISNRMSTVLFMEAARLVDEGVASAEDVDAVARLMYGHKMGPITTLDLAGLDTALKVATALTEHYGGDRFAPPPVLEQLVAAGHFGRKTGSGFYEETS